MDSEVVDISCETQLIITVDDYAKNLDEITQTGVGF